MALGGPDQPHARDRALDGRPCPGSYARLALRDAVQPHRARARSPKRAPGISSESEVLSVSLLMAWAGAQSAWSIALDYDFASYAGRHWSGWSELAAIGGAVLGMLAYGGLGTL